MWLVYIILIIFVILLGIANLFLNFIFGKRCEGNPKLKYFTHKDFEKLDAKDIEFSSDKGQIIRGKIYTNKDIKEYKRLLIFVHGMGGGHLSYTTEINTFAKAGYIVLSYDNTGTCSSEGKNLKGFFQSVNDLKYVLKSIEKNEELNKYEISLVGHSWGAYTVCQILQFNFNIKSVVSISAPNDTNKLICDLLKNETKINFNFLKPFFIIINFLKFGKDGVKNTVEVLKKVQIPVLLLHGKNDRTVEIENSLVCDKDVFKSQTNIEIIMYDERYHNVYQTNESEKYLNSVFGQISEFSKKYKGNELEEKLDSIYKNIDYKKITEEDENVMNTIIEFLNKN